jgi:hypothetical protein
LTDRILQFGDFTDSGFGFTLRTDNPGETQYCAALSRQYFKNVYGVPVNNSCRQQGIGDLCYEHMRRSTSYRRPQKQQIALHKTFSFSELVEYVKLQNI